MTTLAAIRPDDWNFPLLVHAAGAMILVGALLTGGSLLAFARGNERMLRLGYWTLLTLALPGYVLLRIGAEWLYTKYDDVLPEGVDDPGWITIGYVVADLGALLLLVTLIVGGIGVRRLGSGKGSGFLKAAMILSFAILAAALVAVWAMAGKPD